MVNGKIYRLTTLKDLRDSVIAGCPASINWTISIELRGGFNI
jgi:hypothetical protein